MENDDDEFLDVDEAGVGNSQGLVNCVFNVMEVGIKMSFMVCQNSLKVVAI